MNPGWTSRFGATSSVPRMDGRGLYENHTAFIYPEDERFETVEEQEPQVREQGWERFVRRWCSERAKMPEKNLTFRWYEAMYVQTVKSIFPKQDPSKVLEDCEKDVLVLEEPEHLCWYHEGQRCAAPIGCAVVQRRLV
ncbi:Digalactosyldiacylglycerol synthase 2 [Durusdinium trenchii]|uniref:Chloroplastic n=1 Tax=Durusdinium trenchii TaxID=1381693 RepID=A0ABP0Q5Y0_9DINO